MVLADCTGTYNFFSNGRSFKKGWTRKGPLRVKLEKKLKQIPYQHIFAPRSCIRSGLDTQNLFTLNIHRRIFRRVKSKMADYLSEITWTMIINHLFVCKCAD